MQSYRLLNLALHYKLTGKKIISERDKNFNSFTKLVKRKYKPKIQIFQEE